MLALESHIIPPCCSKNRRELIEIGCIRLKMVAMEKLQDELYVDDLEFTTKIHIFKNEGVEGFKKKVGGVMDVGG